MGDSINDQINDASFSAQSNDYRFFRHKFKHFAGKSIVLYFFGMHGTNLHIYKIKFIRMRYLFGFSLISSKGAKKVNLPIVHPVHICITLCV